jgi:hypothetical protein
LRVETAQMLNLDIADLSLVAGLQLDLVSLLRLEVDGLQGSALAGEQIDLDRLSTALGMLRQLLPERALVSAPPPPPETRFGDQHRKRLRELVERVVLREDPGDPGEVERLRDACEREERTMADEGAGREPEPVPAAPMAPPARPQRKAPTYGMRMLSQQLRLRRPALWSGCAAQGQRGGRHHRHLPPGSSSL